TMWMPAAGDVDGSSFSATGARAVARSSPRSRTWAYDATIGVQRVSDRAPLTLWPGAGDGRARTPLLRAHPLLDGGRLDIDASTVFGRSTRYASVEGQRWLSSPTIVGVGLAAFVDVAQASRQLVRDAGPVQTDVGGGLRVRIPGAGHVLRVDVAHGLRD